MFQQSIMQSLQTIFPGLQWGQLSGLTPEGIAGGFATEYDIEPEDLPSSLFQSISPGLFKGADYSTYSPMMQTEGSSLLTNLQSSLGGADVTKAHGGFAGSGGAKRKEKQVRDVYGKSMGETYSSIRGMQAQGLQGIQDRVDAWHQAAQSIKGY